MDATLETPGDRARVERAAQGLPPTATDPAALMLVRKILDGAATRGDRVGAA
jgi:hypothetical protein